MNRKMLFTALLLVGVGSSACSGPEDPQTCTDCVNPDTGDVNNEIDTGNTGVNNPPNNGTSNATNNNASNDPNDDCRVQNFCTAAEVCNSATGLCVECVTDAECGNKGLCDPGTNVCECEPGFHACNGTCVNDISIQSCGDSCTPCPDDPNGNPTCDGKTCGLMCGPGYSFDADTAACVQCTQQADCTDPSASVCDLGTCEPCTVGADCAHLSDTPICDAGACVECSAADDSACNGNSCDTATGTCTTTPKGSVDRCGSCLADSECTAGHACAPMDFKGSARSGGYCLPVDSGSCDEPQYPTASTKTSLSGVLVDVCTINESLTTCEALGDYFNGCATADDCGAANLDDGLCGAVDFDFAKCTYPCDASDQCPTASVIGCTTGDIGSTTYCGGF